MYDINSSMTETYELIAESILSNSLSWIASVAAYILLAVGMYSIADRRGISKPWLAWIPFGQNWILGSISDQFQYVAMGQNKSKRKVLLTLEILVSILSVAICVILVAALWDVMVSAYSNGVFSQQIIERRVMELTASLMIVLLLSLVLLGLAIAHAIVQYMALYDLYRSCDPANATLFTVLSIFLGGLLLGLLVLVCRKKDLGMPPRRDQVFAQPGYLPPQGGQPQQQNWQQPTQPPVDPWQQNQQPRDPWAP